MGFVSKGLLKNFWRVEQCSVRYKSTINVQNPRPPHFERAKLLKLCEPRYPKKIDPETPLYEVCKGPNTGIRDKENPLENFLAQDALNLFKNHQFSFFYHLNSVPYTEYTDMRIQLSRLGVKTQRYGKRILKKAFEGTIYEPTLILFHGHTLVGFSNNVNIKSMMDEMKNTNVVLMAGIVNNKLLSVSELKNYSELPDIQSLRVSLVSVLSSAGARIVQQLNQHPSTVVQHLDAHAKNSEGKS